jgi:hypothetical protein
VSWTDVEGNNLKLPLSEVNNTARAIDYQSQGKNVYLKDMAFDKKGNPICLYVTSGGHEPGPDNAPYEWRTSRWTGKKWDTRVICQSDHNYDMGSLFIEDDTWAVVGPTDDGPQKHGTGGEVVLRLSSNKGKEWTRVNTLTNGSRLNHSYVRRALNYRNPFCFFWADGDAHQFSKSELYFGNFKGDVYKLPYFMKSDTAKPVLVR